jgi:hypothetical protein
MVDSSCTRSCLCCSLSTSINAERVVLPVGVECKRCELTVLTAGLPGLRDFSRVVLVGAAKVRAWQEEQVHAVCDRLVVLVFMVPRNADPDKERMSRSKAHPYGRMQHADVDIVDNSIEIRKTQDKILTLRVVLPYQGDAGVP